MIARFVFGKVLPEFPQKRQFQLLNHGFLKRGAIGRQIHSRLGGVAASRIRAAVSSVATASFNQLRILEFLL